MILHGYPYSDNHEMNLDWIISKTNEMIVSNKSLKLMVDEAEDTMNAKTSDFISRVNQHTLALEALTNTINTHIGAITNVGNNIATDIEFLGWAVPRECPVQNYIDPQGRFHQKVNRVALNTLVFNLANFITSRDVYWVSFTQSQSTGYIYGYPEISGSVWFMPDKSFTFGDNLLYICDNSYNRDASAFMESISNLYLYYEMPTEVIYKVGQEKVFRTAAQIYGLNLSDEASEDYEMSDDLVNVDMPSFMTSDVPVGKYVEPTESDDEEVNESDEEITESDEEITESDGEE